MKISSLNKGVVILSLMFFSGCVPYVAGSSDTGTPVAYIAGEMQATENHPLNSVYEAAKLALVDLGFVVTKDDKDILWAALVARGSEDKKVNVQLSRTSESVTSVRIRVELLGDQTLSQLILQKIEEKL